MSESWEHELDRYIPKQPEIAAQFFYKMKSVGKLLSVIQTNPYNADSFLQTAHLSDQDKQHFLKITNIAITVRKLWRLFDGKISGAQAVESIRLDCVNKEIFEQIRDLDDIQLVPSVFAIFLRVSPDDYHRIVQHPSDAHLNTDVVYLPRIGNRQIDVPFGFCHGPLNNRHEDLHAAMFASLGVSHINPLADIWPKRPEKQISNVYQWFLRRAGEEVLAGFAGNPDYMVCSQSKILQATTTVNSGPPYNFYDKFLNMFDDETRGKVERDFSLGRWAFVESVRGSIYDIYPVVRLLEQQNIPRPEIAHMLAYSLAHEPINRWREIIYV